MIVYVKRCSKKKLIQSEWSKTKKKKGETE